MPIVLWHSPAFADHMGKALDLPLKGRGGLLGVVVLRDSRSSVPPWTLELADTEEAFIILPTWLDVDRSLDRNMKGTPSEKFVTDLHRMLIRHETTHWMRNERGYFEGIYEPRPWNPLRIVWEEVVANVRSRHHSMHWAVQWGILLLTPVHVAMSTWIGSGRGAGLLWHATFGRLGEDPREGVGEQVKKFTDPPRYSGAKLELLLRRAEKLLD